MIFFCEDSLGTLFIEQVCKLIAFSFFRIYFGNTLLNIAYQCKEYVTLLAVCDACQPSGNFFHTKIAKPAR